MKKWIDDEFSTIDFGDKRLDKRMKEIMDRMMESPMASIKSAFKGWAEVMGAYRFFRNKKATSESILSPHQDKTLERIKEHTRVMSIQDTTELDYTAKKSLKGTGPLSSKERQGFFVHSQFVVTPERLPLGVWDSEIYARDEKKHGQSKKRQNKPIEEKESFRWLKGYRDTCELAQKAPNTMIIACTDREGDIYEIFEEWHNRQKEGKSVAELLIRCKHNRNITKGIVSTTQKIGKDDDRVE